MRPLKLMLLNDSPLGELRCQLQEVLDAAIKVGARELGPIELFSYRLDESLTTTISQVKPNLLLLALVPNQPMLTASAIRSIIQTTRGIPIVLVVGDLGADQITDLIQLGVTDLISHPLKSVDILPRVWRTMDSPAFDVVSTQKCKQALGLQEIIGESPVLMEEVSKIPSIAKFDVSVMISGPTGTGKELVARAIHYLSPRSAKSFIPVNCGAIPLELIENELFGHRQGAFTNATTSERGVIQEANGGTLFFDEIDSLPLRAQVKLLRFLQEKEFKPLGSARTLRSDVRVIAATSIDLERAILAGEFRRDLYYRLNVITLNLPPLKNRQADIPLLARHFLAKYADQFGKEAQTFSVEASQMLLLHDWPGNVRELENVVMRALILSEGPVIEKGAITLSGNAPANYPESFREAKHRLIDQFERAYLQELLLNFQGNITHAAKAARKDRRSLWQLVRKHEINVQDFRPKVVGVNVGPHH